MKLTNICFKTNDLLACVVKLAMFHKTQVWEKGGKIGKWSSLKSYWKSRANDQAWRVIEDQGQMIKFKEELKIKI